MDGPVPLIAGTVGTVEDGKDQIAGPWNLTVPLLMRESRDHTSGFGCDDDRRQVSRGRVQRLRI